MINFKAQTESRKLRLDILDAIGADFVGGGVTAKMVSSQIAQAGEDIEQIEVHLNSPGGDAFDGVAIYNQLKQFPGQVNVFIDGVAASAASIIAMAGDQRVVSTGGQIMIHNASAFTFGDRKSHQRQSRSLSKLDKGLADIYAEATGTDAATIAEMMDEETWLDADDALAEGFATHVAPAKAEVTNSLRMLNLYQNVPSSVAAWAGQGDGDQSQPTAETLNMPDEPIKPDEEVEATNAEEMPEEEETMESLKARIAELEAQLADDGEGEAEEEDEEQPAEAQAIAQAFAHDKAFAVDMIGQGKSLDESYRAYAAHAQAAMNALANQVEAANDGVNPVAIASRPEPDNTPDDLAKVYNRARDMRTDMGRNAFLNDQGISPSDYAAWLKSNG